MFDNNNRNWSNIIAALGLFVAVIVAATQFLTYQDNRTYRKENDATIEAAAETRIAIQEEIANSIARQADFVVRAPDITEKTATITEVWLARSPAAHDFGILIFVELSMSIENVIEDEDTMQDIDLETSPSLVSEGGSVGMDTVLGGGPMKVISFGPNPDTPGKHRLPLPRQEPTKVYASVKYCEILPESNEIEAIPSRARVFKVSVQTVSQELSQSSIWGITKT